MDRRTPRRVELLLWKARAKDHACRLEPTRNHPCWLRPCYSWAKSVNPVARAGEGTDRADAVFAANRAVGSLAFSVKQVAGKTRRAMVHEAGSLRVRCPGAP